MNDLHQHWKRLDRSRLAAPGNRPADAARWTARGGIALIALASAWLLFAAVRPLPTPDPIESDHPPPIPSVGQHAPSLDARREALARLGGVNLFDAERETWSARRRDDPKSADATKPAETKPPPAGTQGTSIGGQTIQVTKAEALPEDVKLALTGLALRGIYTAPAATTPVALISRVHAGPNPLLSDAFHEGDEFEDKQHPQAKWKVVAIDAAGRRVILQRGGINAVLSLYAASAAVASEPAKPTDAAKPLGPTINLQTKEQVEAALRAANVSEEEIKRLLSLAEMAPEEAATAAKLEALARAEKEAPNDQKPGRRSPPAGLEAIAKLLQQAPKPPEDAPPPPPGTTAEKKPE